MSQSQVLANYLRLSALTSEMADASSCEDWEKLVELERIRSNLVESMKAADETTVLDGSARDQKHQIIGNVLAVDEQIRERVMTWLDFLQQNMQSNRQAQRLLKTYGA